MRKKPLNVVHHFVEREIRHRDVSKVPVIVPTISLNFHQFWLDLLLPVELRRLLGQARNLAIGSIHLANQTYNIVLDIVLALEHVQFYSIGHSFSQHRQTTRLANYVLDDAVLTRHHEVPIFEEGETFDYPIFCFVALIVFPLLRRKILVAVWQFQVFTEQATDLRLCPHSKVSDYHALLLSPRVHTTKSYMKK